MLDSYNNFYFNGNEYWDKEKILNWWKASENRYHYILERYATELEYKENPHFVYAAWAGKKLKLLGPNFPVPENYRNWLLFFHNGMKEYLETYIYILEKKALPEERKEIYKLPEIDIAIEKEEKLHELFEKRKEDFINYKNRHYKHFSGELEEEQEDPTQSKNTKASLWAQFKRIFGFNKKS